MLTGSRIAEVWAREPDIVVRCEEDECPPQGTEISVREGLMMWASGSAPVASVYAGDTGEPVSRDGVRGRVLRVRPVRPALRYPAWIVYLVPGSVTEG